MLASETYTFDPRPDYPLVTTAKRYSPLNGEPNGVTLIFAHGTGFHKESWEPTIDDLLVSTSGKGVKEIWSVDAPNHGDAALLNEDALSWGYDKIFRWSEYARMLHMFFAGLGTFNPPLEASFTGKATKLVGIGHSMGAIALLLSLTHQPPLSSAFQSIICVDMMCIPRKFVGAIRNGREEDEENFLAKGAIARRDRWPDWNSAFVGLLKGRKNWDQRAVDNYVRYALVEKQDGVVLKCPKKQETACYRDQLSHSIVYRFLPDLCKRTKVHFVWGAIADYLPIELKDDLRDTAGPALGSVSFVEGAGHLVPQMNPTGLAKAIGDILRKVEAKARL